jgi:hypothetical protein
MQVNPQANIGVARVAQHVAKEVDKPDTIASGNDEHQLAAQIEP